jgi:two-component system NtrC family sensor kinase
MHLIRKLKIRGKLLAVVLSLVVVPVLVAGIIGGFVSKRQACLGLTETRQADPELYRQTEEIESPIIISTGILVFVIGLASGVLIVFASKVLTDPIRSMITGIREIKQGRLNTQLLVNSNDELGELARDINLMMEVIRQNKALAANLAEQAKTASLGVLSLSVVHKINNPLGIISSYAAYLEGKMIPSDPKYKYIQEIKRESNRCKTIVQDLLSYAQVPKPFLEETDLNALLDKIIDFAAYHIDPDQVQVEKVFDPQLPHIMVDRDQLRQVAINLIVNADAAMNGGGRLTVATSLGEDGFINLTFQDNGTGISAQDLDKIFEPFFTTKNQETGLGLAISKIIIEQHGGTIRVDSEPGKGTTVTVSLPNDRQHPGKATETY